ncbi:MAG: GNAT family N-acetyltransferase [Desulfobacteraceae bacterium]|nr:MAG: GNAT family N-acetyltransferase [Desulfobacteraceae bacterium]
MTTTDSENPFADFRNLSFRETPDRDDPEKIFAIVEATGFFSEVEIEISVELVRERLLYGVESGYFFLFAEDSNKRLVGYTCYGPVTGTQSSFDLYWIVVGNNFQGCGLGKLLDGKTVDLVRKMGGTRIYAETSSREQYEPTREFYLKAGYHETAYLEDFYAPGDGKIIFVKKVV